jgi:NAD(P)H-hydrate epimerase
MPAPRQQPASNERLPIVAAEGLPWLTVEQMREVDRVMMEELQITLVRMMENAGSSLAEVARILLGGSADGKRIVVLAGPGGNGGGGLVAARHLANAGANVEVCLAVPPRALTPVPREQLEILLRIGVTAAPVPPPDATPDLVLDALLGYSQSGDPRGAAAELIEWTAERRVLALDNPSGLELSTGQVRSPAIRAAATMTLALPKDALRASGVAAHVGNVYLADISVPALVYERLGLNYRSPFAESRIVSVGSPVTPTVSDAREGEGTT